MSVLRVLATWVGIALLSSCVHRQVPPAPAPQPSPSRQNDWPSLKPFREVIPKDAVTDSGLFVVHQVRDKWYYEIPLGLLGREMLIVSRRARTANNLGYGGEENATLTVRWQRHDNRVLLRYVSHTNVASDSLPIVEAVRNSNFEPVIEAFDIATFATQAIDSTTTDTTAVVIDVTDLFTTDVPILGLPRSAREEYEVRSLDRDRTFINGIRSYPRNIEVRVVLTYNAAKPPSNAATGAISVEMNHSMILLPETPMQPRLADERVGSWNVAQTDYGRSDQRVVTRRYLERWRLEPSDTAAFLRGELVAPVKPIVFYIDPATPERWRPYLKQGVEDWNVAFAEAGFRNAILARDPPSSTEDPEFSLEDVRYSVIRWFPSPTQGAYGWSVSDPRTGESLQGNVAWHHNMMNLLRNWYFIQTAAANPEARRVQFDDAVMGKLIRVIIAHEVGHSLGLAHNQKASSTYPVDSLRSASFTCRMHTAPSIMDYARFNYVAQPEDEGVCFMPGIGPWDLYAIMWAYRPILSAASPDAERPTLDRWIRERDGNPYYHYGGLVGVDPTNSGDALGDDPMRASAYGIANLKRIVPNLIAWSYREHESNEELEELYGQVIAQWNLYMWHVAMEIGGVVKTPRSTDQAGPVYAFVDEATQRRAMQFLAEQAFTPPTWLINEDILRRIENVGTVERMRRIQVRAVNFVLDPARMQRVIEAEGRTGAAAYGLGEMLGDLRAAVWSELSRGRSIDVYRRNLQRGYLARMEYLMTAVPDSVPTAEREYSTTVNVPQSDIRPFVRGELETLKREIPTALGRKPNSATRLHLEDVRVRIDRILDPRIGMVPIR